MPAPGIYHVIGTEVNGVRHYESAMFEDGYYDDPGFEIEYWLESFEVNEDDLECIIQPHAITLERGNKAVMDIMYMLSQGEDSYLTLWKNTPSRK